MAYHRGFVVYGPYKNAGLFQTVPTANWHWNQKISWGQPALIAQTVLDKCCPYCQAIPGIGYITKVGKAIPGGFDIGYNDDGSVFGCRCPNCGFSF